MKTYNANEDIRRAISEKRLFNYEVAEKLGVSEFTFARWLRYELSEEKKELVINAINELASES